MISSVTELSLPAVENLFARALNSSVYLSWNLPLASNDDNVTYCVDVVDGRENTIHTKCALTETEYTFVLPNQSWCNQYFFTVTPTTANSNGTQKRVPFFADISRKYKVQPCNFPCITCTLVPQVIDEPKLLTDNRGIISMVSCA